MWHHRKSRLLITLAAAALLLYAGSYVVLSRWSFDKLEDFDNMGFWYVPVEPRTMNEYPILKDVHTILAALYHPAWLIDHQLNHTPPPDGVDSIDETKD